MKFLISRFLIIGFIFLAIPWAVLSVDEDQSNLRSKIIEIAMQQLGQLYEIGQEGGWPPGLDNSGLVNYSYKKAGVAGFEQTTAGSHGPTISTLLSMCMSDPVSGVSVKLNRLKELGDKDERYKLTKDERYKLTEAEIEELAGLPESIGPEEALNFFFPGDLVFLHATYDKNRDGRLDSQDEYTHVGLYAGGLYAGGDVIIEAGNPVKQASLMEWQSRHASWKWSGSGWEKVGSGTGNQNKGIFAGVWRIKSEYWPNPNLDTDDDDIRSPFDEGNPGLSYQEYLKLDNPNNPFNPDTGLFGGITDSLGSLIGSEKPFGGKITKVHICTCTFNLLITIKDLATPGGPKKRKLIYQPGTSVLHDYYNIFTPGTCLLGTWKKKYGIGGYCADLCENGCCLKSSDGTINFTGTSKIGCDTSDGGFSQ